MSHPIAAPLAPVRPARPPWWLPAYLGGWLLLGLWLGTNAWIGYRGDPATPAWHVFVWELSSAMVIGVLALGVARFESRWRITGAGAWRRLPLHLLAAVAFSLAHVASIIALRKLAYAAAGEHYDFGPLGLGLFYEFQKDILTYASIVAVCALLREIRERRQRQLDELTLRQALSEARLAQLSAQIEPHFVFNTLNAIANRMYEDVAVADRLLVALADLLRAAMRADGSEWVTVAEEARWLHAYCALMAERQPGLLHVAIEVDAQLDRARLPRLLLQPLVENAFRHGLRNGRGHLWIALEKPASGCAARSRTMVPACRPRPRRASDWPMCASGWNCSTPAGITGRPGRAARAVRGSPWSCRWNARHEPAPGDHRGRGPGARPPAPSAGRACGRPSGARMRHAG